MWENRQTAERDVHIRKVAKVPLKEPEPPSGADGYDDYGYSHDQDPPNMSLGKTKKVGGGGFTNVSLEGYQRGKVSTRTTVCCIQFSATACGMLSNLSGNCFFVF